jgi:hypothetical protein
MKLRRFKYVAVALVIAVATLSAPRRMVANWIWPDDAAPWEKVTAIYYPDKTDTSKFVFAGEGLDNVADCRAKAEARAHEKGDDGFKRGSFACAVGFYPGEEGAAGTYRVTVQ